MPAPALSAMRLVHLSDLHFGHHDAAVAATLAADIATQAPQLVVVSGDFTQVGSTAEFEMARAFLDELRAPVFAVPGNHDLGRNPVRRFLDPYGLYRRCIAPEIEPFLELGGAGEAVALAGLNTTRRALADRDWSNGSINRTQLEQLAGRFAAAAPEALRIVVAHHPLMQPALPTLRPTRAVRRSDLALEAFARLGVRLVLSGHFHLSFVRKYQAAIGEGIPPGPRRAAAAPVLVAQASSTISTRLRGEANAYNVIDIVNGTIDVHVREWCAGEWVTREEAEVAA
jgi:3',5'-cyclic AMP phosphodiesterase CpdA